MIKKPQAAGLIDLVRLPGVKTGLGILALVLFSLVSFRVVRHQCRSPADGDWGVYYRAGLAMYHRQPIYTLEHGSMLTFKNAPVVAMMLMPLSLLPVGLARWLWLVADLVSVAATYQLAARVIFRPQTSRSLRILLIACAVLLTIHFVLDELFSGPTAVMVLAVTAAGFVWAYEGKGCRAGFALALGICLKLVPLAFVPWLLCCKSRWTSLTSLGVSLALLAILPATWLGWHRNLELLREWPAHLARTQVPKQDYRDKNQSVNATIIRFMTATPYNVNVVALNLRTARRLGVIVMAIALSSIYAAIAWNLAHGRNDPGAALALLLLYITVFNPLAWQYNYVALGVPYLYVLNALTGSIRSPRLIIGLVIASYVLHFAPLSLQEFGARVWGVVALAVAVWLCWNGRIDGSQNIESAYAVTKSEGYN